MFTGIITDIGHVIAVSRKADVLFRISTGLDIANVAVGASVCCSGVCLTVIDKGRLDWKDWFVVSASSETLSRTTLSEWGMGTEVNLEKSLKMGDEMGGHIVTGHVDCATSVLSREQDGASVQFTFALPPTALGMIASKGSVTLDGVSLTVNEAGKESFSVNIIPHTQQTTTLGKKQIGDRLNLEIDVLARYVANYQENHVRRLV